MNNFDDFIESVKKEDLGEVQRLFKKEFIDRRTNYGHTALHVASTCNNSSDILRYLLDQQFNIEEQIVEGWRCIHIAAWNNKENVLIELIQSGCDLDCLNEGQTEYDETLRGRTSECMNIIKRTKIEKTVQECLRLIENNHLTKIMDLESGETLLDKVLCNKDYRIKAKIKSKPVNDEEIQEWISLKLLITPGSYRLLHECLLARCIYNKYEYGMLYLCSPEIVNKKSQFMNNTTLSTAIEYGLSIYLIKDILFKSVKPDESWTRSEIKNKHVLYLISKRRDYLNEKEKEGFSRLQIAVLENDPEMIEYIMNNQSVKDEKNYKEEGEALSLSYSIKHMDCVKSLQKNKANVNTYDKLKQTPLHIAIYNRKEEYSDYLVNNMLNLEEEDFMNFTLLERSVMNNCQKICERLVEKGASCDKYVKIEKEWLQRDSDLRMILYNTPHLLITNKETIYTLCFKVNKTIYPALLDKIDLDAINKQDGYGNTLLHLSAISLNLEISSKLITKNADLNIQNESQHSPLLELLIQNYDPLTKIKENMIETVLLLIKEGATLNVKDVKGGTVLSIATKYHDEKLLLALIQGGESITCIQKSYFLAWLHKKHYSFIKEVMSFINKSLLRQWITEDIIKNCLSNDNLIISKSLYDEAVDNIQINVLEAILHRAAVNNDMELFKDMIANDISSESRLETGESLLHYLIREKKGCFINVILRQENKKPLLEIVNRENKLPIQVCIESEYWDVNMLLFTDTISVDNEDNNGHTALSLLLNKMSETKDVHLCNLLRSFVNILILHFANIYKCNKYGESVLSCCTDNELKSQIEAQYNQNQELLKKNQIEECSICKDKLKNCVLNCGHMFCMSCAEKINFCSVCRREITVRIQTYGES